MRTVAEPLTPDLRRLHMTVSKGFLAKLERAKAGQSHAQPGASSEQVIEAALDLLLRQQEKRRGGTEEPRAKPRPAKPGRVTAAAKRAVWERDEGKCSWQMDGGGVCGSTTRLEIDHVLPRARGGASTVTNLRILCGVHNQYAARQVYGDEWMDRFTSGPQGTVPVAREPVAPWCRAPIARPSPSACPSHAPRARRSEALGGDLLLGRVWATPSRRRPRTSTRSR